MGPPLWRELPFSRPPLNCYDRPPRSTVMTDPLVMRQYRTTQPLPWGDRPRHLRTQPYVPVCRYRTPFLTRPDPS